MDSPFPELDTARLSLRAMAESDLDGYAELLSEPGTHELIVEAGPVPRSDALTRLRSNREAFASGAHVYWSIEIDSDFAGYVALHGTDTAEPAISYAIRAGFRRRGLAFEAIRAVCAYARDDPRFTAVVARTHPYNAPSRALLSSLGFRDCGEVSWGGEVRREYGLAVT